MVAGPKTCPGVRVVSKAPTAFLMSLSAVSAIRRLLIRLIFGPLTVPIFIAVFEDDEDGTQVFNGGAELFDGVRRQFLGFGQVVAVGQVFVLEPLEAVELEVALADLGDGELAPAITPKPSLAGWRIAPFPLGPAVRVGTEALLELGEMFACERAVLLCDAGDVGAGVVDPRGFGRWAFGEKDKVGLDALAVGRERAARQPQYRVEVT